jgi:hypothetical protein
MILVPELVLSLCLALLSLFRAALLWSPAPGSLLGRVLAAALERELALA